MEEEAFLAALAAEPHDHARRLVYADWLDDHGRTAKAEFLRLEARLTDASEPDPAGEERLAELLRETDYAWREVAGRRFDLMLEGYAPNRKIPVIKAIREAVRIRLVEAAGIAERPLPGEILKAALREQVAAAVDTFAPTEARLTVRPAGGGPAVVAPTAVAYISLLLPYCWPSPLPDGLVRALASVTGMRQEEAELVVRAGGGWVLYAGTHRPAAEAMAARFAGSWHPIRRLDHRPAPPARYDVFADELRVVTGCPQDDVLRVVRELSAGAFVRLVRVDD